MEDLRIQGSGGGSKPEKAHTPVEAPNTLQSFIKGKILDLIAYGPIKGLRNGLKSVYLDNTPVENADGTMNFNGIKLTTRLGYPDQEYIEGFSDVENTFEINTEVKFANPVIRSVSNNNADSVIVTVQVQALTETQENGDATATTLPLAVDVRSGGGAWRIGITDLIQGKTTSPYPVSYRVLLEGEGPFDIRVRRLNQESTTQKKQDALSWTLLTEVLDKKFSYPNMAYVGIEIDSKLFGNQIPARSYDVDLSIVSVPSNYDPITRAYTGLWDGTFKQEWTDNPAWCFYDLATHPVIGAGLENVDKWVLYRIGQYCDELVEDGYGGMEPRFTCNTIFADQEDAVSALNTFASCFRGMAYWGTNTMVPVADMPDRIAKVVSPANVIGGDFDYSGTGMRERHSVCVVMWNDMDDAGKAVPEVYEDPDSVVLFGWRETRVTAVACSSRGQARRLAKWILYSERMETQTVNYKATMDHADLRPGELIELADPDYQGARMGGRIISGTVRKLTLDAVPSAVEQLSASAWFISVPMPNGSIEKAEVSSFTGNDANLLRNLSDVPIKGAMWALSCLELELPQFRVVSVNEETNGEYTINATEYDPRKYDIVEKGLILPERPTSLFPSGSIAPPLDLSFEVYTYFAGADRHQGLVISWTPPKDVRVNEYILDVKSPADAGFVTVYNGAGVSFDLKDAMGGEWVIRVRSVASGIPGEWVTRTVQIATLLLPVPPDSVKVTVGTFNITLTPVSAYPNLLWEFWRSDVPLSFDQIESNATKLPTGTYLVDANLRSGKTYFYFVRGTNQYGRSAWFSTQGTTLEDFDDIMEHVKEDIINGELYQIINGQITEVATEVATEVSTSVVADAVAELQAQIDGLVDALAYVKENPYNEGEVVRSGKNLWMALVNVPADPTGASGPPNPLYWKNIGDILEEANGLAVQVQQNKTDIKTVDGKVTAAASQLTVLQAKARQNVGEGDLQDALAGYKAQASFTQEVKVLANTDQALSQRITAFSVSLDGNSAKLSTLEQTVVTNEQALSQRITDFSAEYKSNKATVQTSIKAVSDANSATAAAVTTLNTDYQGNKVTVQDSIKAVSDAQSATATSLSTLTTDYQGNKVTVQTNIKAVSDAQAATAASLSLLNTDYQGNKSSVQSDIKVVSDAQKATATKVDTLRTDVNGNSATIQTVQQTANSAYGTANTANGTANTANGKADSLNQKLTAQYAIKLQLAVDGRTYAAGMGIDITSQGGITQSQILFQADRIAMLNVNSGGVVLPWLLENGTVYMNTAVIKNGTVSFLQIADDLQSTNWSAANRTGWKFAKAGNLTIYANGAKGSSEFNGAEIIMRDTNGTVRIKMSVN
ncbi:putative tip attachment protein [Pseudomonas phage UAntarctica]|nr:putative tip attachment protein [Pseudomonas phage UAntarctica]